MKNQQAEQAVASMITRYHLGCLVAALPAPAIAVRANLGMRLPTVLHSAKLPA